MNGVVSVVTAVDVAGSTHLDDAYRSLCLQELPEGWSLQWCVGSYGLGVLNRRYLERDERIRYNLTFASSPAAARNVALAHAAGDVIVVLDPDDLLLPGALHGFIEVFSSQARVMWAAGRTQLLYSDGNTGPYVEPLRPGIIAPGWLYDYRRRHRASTPCPLHPRHIAVRRGVLLSMGGWPAFPDGVDELLLYAVAEVHPGFALDANTHQYRRWVSSPQAPALAVPGEQSLVDLALVQRITAMRASSSVLFERPHS